MNLTQSLHNEVKGKGIRVQAVLPGATRTPFWDRANLPIESAPEEMVMTAEGMVDASLAGLDQGELITIPSLPDIAEWEEYEAARKSTRTQPDLQAFSGSVWHQRLTERRSSPVGQLLMRGIFLAIAGDAPRGRPGRLPLGYRRPQHPYPYRMARRCDRWRY